METWCEIGPTSRIMQVSCMLMHFITHIVNFFQLRGHFVKPWYEYKSLEQSFVLSYFGNPELENNPMNCAVLSNISRHRCLFISTINIQLCRIWWYLVVGLQTANNWIPLVSLANNVTGSVWSQCCLSVLGFHRNLDNLVDKGHTPSVDVNW